MSANAKGSGCSDGCLTTPGSSPVSSTPSSPELTLAEEEEKRMEYFHCLGERVGSHLTNFSGWFTYAGNVMSAVEAEKLGYCGGNA